MRRFINPFSDVGFKKIFGQEINKELLIEFLNDLLEGEKRIEDIRFLDKESLPLYENDRTGIYDISCQTEAGEHFIVEMQNIRQVHFSERALYYLTRALAYQGEKSAHWQFELNAVYGVFFMNFRLNGRPGKLRTDVVLTDRETHEQFSDKLRFIFLELPSFRKEEEECETDFERWIYVLKNMETLKRIPFKARKSVFEKLEKIADLSSLSKAERIKYDASIKAYRDHLATIAYGKEEGKVEGRSEGRVEGERNKQIEIARKLKAKGLSIDLISETTGLSAEEVGKL